MSNTSTHSLIKFFSSALAQDGTLPSDLQTAVAAFVGPTICAKSIGVEFVESRNIALVSLGYSEEPGLPVNLTSEKIGELVDGEPVDLEKLGAAASGAAARRGGVICHEFYVTAEGAVFAVFLALQLV